MCSEQIDHDEGLDEPPVHQQNLLKSHGSSKVDVKIFCDNMQLIFVKQQDHSPCFLVQQDCEMVSQLLESSCGATTMRNILD